MKKEKAKTYSELLDTANMEIAAEQKAIKELEAKLKELKDNLENTQREKTFLLKLKYMKKAAVKPYMWNVRRQNGSDYSNEAWYEYWSYNMAKIELKTSITERKDLKKMKWEVKISGNKSTLATNVGHNGYVSNSYADHDYIKNMYMTHRYDSEKRCSVWEASEAKGNIKTLTLKFDSEAKARTWMKAWQVKLIKDHADIIKYEMSLYNQIVIEAETVAQ